MRQFFPYLASLPAAVNAAAVADENGDYTIYINESLSEAARYDALCHELRHILLGHHEGEAAPGAERRADAPLLAEDIARIAQTGLLPAVPLVEQKRLVPKSRTHESLPPEARREPPLPEADDDPPPPADDLLDAILRDLETLEASWNEDV